MINAAYSTILRRGIALASLCMLVATATVIWLGNDMAQASPGQRQAQTRSTRAQATRGHAPPAATLTQRTQRIQSDDPAGADATPKRSKSNGGKTLRGKLNLNTATEAELVMLPGVGPAKARRIIESRTKEGRFRRVRDLRRVKGIGAKTLQKLEPYLTVEGTTTLTRE